MNDNILPVGTLLRAGTYRIEKQLASGGFGNTYVVRNVSFDEVYAMKEFFMREINIRENSTVTVTVSENKPIFDSQLAKFKKEAIRLRKLGNLQQFENKHLVKVHDFFEENGTAYYIMDFINGETLFDIANKKGLLEEQEAMGIFRQMLDALSVVHNQEPQILHMDIKPANIMVGKEGNAFLLDFGSSKQIDKEHQGTTSSAFTLTPGYAPPEQVDADISRIGPWTDLYGLGATLYDVLTGYNPPSMSEILEDGEKAFIFPETISSQTRRLICWLMAPKRGMRPCSVEEVKAWLDTPDEPTGPETPSGDKEDDDETTFGPDDSKEPAPKPVYPKPQSKNERKPSLYVIGGIIASVILLVLLFGWKSTGCSNSGKNAILQNLINNMVFVEGGTFTMGDNWEEADDDERPVHNVTLSSFSIGKYEVTQEEWEAVMGSNPSGYKGAKRPVETVTWTDCQKFIKKLNSKTGKNFRLPTEAEWEFAAKGGNKSRGFMYAGYIGIDQVAWYEGNSDNQSHVVGTKSPNELGIYDMTGNVWEWCQDWYGEYSNESQTNPTGPASGEYRVGRGGSLVSPAPNCRVTYRAIFSPDSCGNLLGLRLVY